MGVQEKIHKDRVVTDGLVDAVARCLAKIDGPFVGASDWAGAAGDSYRDKARQVLQTIDRHNSGIQSGGLPPARPAPDPLERIGWRR